MSMILAPFSAPPDILGIGDHRLEFDESGRCPDPGLNDGERAYLAGRGYRFTDSPSNVLTVGNAVVGGPVIGEVVAVAAEAPVAETATVEAEAPAKPARRPRTRKKPTTSTDTAPAADEGVPA